MGPEFLSMRYSRTIIWQRWAAMWLDIIVRAVVITLMIVLSDGGSLPVSIGLAILFFILYYPILEGLTGQTFGKWVCHLNVVDADGNRPGIIKATIRTLLRLVEINPFLFGGIPAAIAVSTSPKRQRLGDMLAKTYVLRAADLAALPTEADAWRSAYDLESPLAAPMVPRIVRRSLGLKAWAILLILPGFSLLNSGFQGRKAEAANRHPIQMTATQFMHSPVKAGWYHITDCSLNLAESIWETYQTKSDASDSNDSSDSTPKKISANDAAITEVFIPVMGGADQKKAGLVIATHDEQIKEIADEIRKIDEKDETAINKWVLKNRDRILVNRDFTGTIREADSFSDITTLSSTLEGHFDVTPKFGILTEGDAPYTGNPSAALAVGAIFTFIAGLFWLGPWRRLV